MRLTLQGVSKKVGSETHLHPLDLSLEPGAVTVLLGATLAGKTSLMRLMAGLDRPSAGRVLEDERDVTGMSVRQRNLAMVYQQFINYPSLTVYENIASPLRIARRPADEIKRRVGDIAETLHLTPFLDRYPAELSGGQQQRTALARALAKDAKLLLLDEPLVNLDYKLREELRLELTNLFAGGRTTVVYATTEPQEALQLAGYTAVLHEGRLLQYGPTLEVFARPESVTVARAFSDPPINLLTARYDASKGEAALAGGLAFALAGTARDALAAHAQDDFTLGVRAHQFRLAPRSPADCAIAARVDLAEISGSETFLHVSRDGLSLVAQLPGVHDLDLGSPCTLYVDPAQLYGYQRSGALLFAPSARGA